jgi:hypothetical protein
LDAALVFIQGEAASPFVDVCELTSGKQFLTTISM